ncbi:MAG: tRNA (adenosine(37)-N6)-threonylcarbamoyltransferase complex transferase subunit TsaD [Candidatus Pacebacteria bacterium]|nr:tRNA (adenosine(37)-N6)-threonylcarbamoyltransferase complex transferase subunit TsaD [Candidatus Paceibacterota bacterium]PIR59951.1 MAG: tRNA (adenosine(37)-N6)-threonylcarbamoyltransferase complex transferase subunit TsaD [Candidatus Pacebacteria bacterium CG10_big_fil_rev_8_21_14_0_10_44_54]
MKNNLILAIDTSCDDTSVAVTSGKYVLSNIIASQTELHKQYGGVFPTVAKQAHKEQILPAILIALKRAGANWQDMAAVAVTQGPGLAPALEVGIATAKRLSSKHQIPLIPVNHLEGHVLSVLAQPKPQNVPWQKLDTLLPQTKNSLSILVSGGNTLFVKTVKIGKYKVLGQTLDDAAGECLDKIGRMLNLGYPAGPVIEQFAKLGDPKAVPFPLPLTMTKTYDLSFSGLKTAARNLLEENGVLKPLEKQAVYDFCASIQFAVFRHITYKLNKLLVDHEFSQIWLGGGVAANATLRRMIRETIRTNAGRVQNPKLAVPYSKKLCMDNAAMIGVVASYKPTQKTDSEKIERRPRWGLGELKG